MSLGNRYTVVTPTKDRPWFLLIDPADEILGRFDRFDEVWELAVLLASFEPTTEGSPR